MELTKDTVRKVAEVARLNLTEDELNKFTPQLKDILDAFSQINEIDTLDTPMSIQPVEIRDAFRKDIVKESLSVEEALKNTEHKKGDYFKGPRAI
jgi:aspartyl-tRNA(Asn)/glutamyl-tRNA(Gln) amidotransferase subunit C